MPGLLPPEFPSSPRAWDAVGLNVYTTTGSGSLDYFLTDTSLRTVNDVRCCYCGRSVQWQYGPNGRRACDIQVFPQYHDCQGRQGQFGANNPVFISDSWSAATLGSYFANMVSMGMTWVRGDLSWSYVQPTNSTTWTWANGDTFMSLAKQYGLKVLLICERCPSWANGGQSSTVQPTSAHYGDYASFVAATAVRYAPQVNAIEIWNEPNLGWNGAPNAAEYASLLQQAYTAVKAVNPNMVVTIAGLAAQTAPSTPTNIYTPDFLQGVYSAIGNGYFDAMNYHPYGFSLNLINALRAVMSANGDSAKKIWFSEYGNPTGGTSGQQTVSESQQADLAVQFINNVRLLPWCGPTMFYGYKDVAFLQPDREGYFGLYRSDDTPKPAVAAIRTAIATKV